MNAARHAAAWSLVAALGCRQSAAPPRVPREALAWVPPYARAAVALELEPLRRAPSLSRWMAERSQGDCAARLSTRVRQLVGVSLDGSLTTAGIILVGRFGTDEVLRCVRAKAPSARTNRLRHRAIALTRVQVDADGGAEIDLVSEGVALIGPPFVARALLDAGISHAGGESSTSALRALWDALPSSAHVRGAWRPDAATRRALGVDALRGHARAGESLALTITAHTGDDERALALAHRAMQWRDATTPTLQSAPLRELVRELRVRAEGASLSASVRLDARRLEALWTSLSMLAAGL